MLQALRSEGAVEIEAEGKPRIWKLAQGQAEALQAELAAEQRVGDLLAGQRILRVVVD
jgi:hypothetical protein